MSKRSQPHAAIAVVPVPPRDPRPYVPTITLPSSRETAFLALHDSVAGFLMHWINNQHEPHVRDREWCAGCKAGQTPRWEGFIGVISLNSCNRFIMRLPAAAFRESGVFRDKSDAGLLGGTVFTSYRFGRHAAKNNPAVIELVDQVVPVPRAKPFPLAAALSRLWNRETLDLIDQVKRPEDAATQQARDFARFAQSVNASRRKGKEAGQ